MSLHEVRHRGRRGLNPRPVRQIGSSCTSVRIFEIPIPDRRLRDSHGQKPYDEQFIVRNSRLLALPPHRDERWRSGRTKSPHRASIAHALSFGGVRRSSPNALTCGLESDWRRLSSNRLARWLQGSQHQIPCSAVIRKLLQWFRDNRDAGIDERRHRELVGAQSRTFRWQRAATVIGVVGLILAVIGILRSGVDGSAQQTTASVLTISSEPPADPTTTSAPSSRTPPTSLTVPGEDSTGVTELRRYVAYDANGDRNPQLSELRREEGNCWVGSIILDRPGAFRCITASSFIYDPCFARPITRDEVLCPTAPWETHGLIIEAYGSDLLAPGEGHEENQTNGTEWAVELETGQKCHLSEPGAGPPVVGGERVRWSCVPSGYLVGFPYAKGPNLVADFLEDGDHAAVTTLIEVAWR